MPWRKLSIFSRVYDNGDVLTRLPLFARAELDLSWADQVDHGDRFKIEIRVALGHVASDHVGYASFDLSRATEAAVLLPELAQVPSELLNTKPRIQARFFVLPFADEFLAVETHGTGDATSRIIVARLELAARDLIGKTLSPSMASMQDPDIDDWRLSPSSFATNPSQLVGQDGCEQIYPANFATSQFKFSQVVRIVDAQIDLKSSLVSGVRYGYLVEYRNEWLPIGHSLGRILYSLPLAPGEKVQLAIVDWRRTDEASRSEETTLAEALDHSQSRDRTISEVVLATVRERQGGHSFMGGLASTMTGTLGYMNMGGSNALGFASTSSSGSRTISADTTQRLSDSLQQTSTAIRQLRSTVITQASQAEHARAETRTVANYNHCHALTMTYYEVLHFHRVSTSVDRVRPVLFIKMDPAPEPDLDNEHYVLSYRRTIEAALLDARHIRGVRALVELVAARKALEYAQARYGALPPQARDMVFSRFMVVVSTGDDGTDNNIALTAVKKNGEQVRLRQVEPADRGTSSEYHLGSEQHDDFEANALDAFMTRPDSPIAWGDLRGFVFELVWNDSAQSLTDTYRLSNLRIIGLTDTGDTRMVLDHTSSQTLGINSAYPEFRVIAAEPSTNQPAPQLTDYISGSALAAVELLMDHLAAYRQYYESAILEDLDSEARWRTLDSTFVGGLRLADLVENEVVGRAGSELAFPLTASGDYAARALFKLDKNTIAPGFWRTEDLIALPTRGVFGEAILGRCSACEKLDNTRYWDWQQSPIPGDGPAISPVDLASRARASSGLEPSAMPASIVNIATPLAAPDPVAMANALQILGKGDTFRDMSGISQLGPFLTSMSESTAAAVSAMGGNRRDNELMDKVLNNEEFSPEQKAELAGRILGGERAPTTGGSPPAVVPAAPASDSTATVTPPEPAQPKPSQPVPLRKPARPQPRTPGKVNILVSPIDLKGQVEPGSVQGQLTVRVAGATAQQTALAGIAPSNDLQLVIDEPADAEGTAAVRLQWDQVFSGRELDIVNSDGRRPTAAGGSVVVEASGPWHLAPGANTVIMKAEVKFRDPPKEVTARTHQEAQAKVEVQGGLLGKIYKVISAGLSVDASGSSSTSSTIEQKYFVHIVEGLSVEQTD